MLEAQEVLEENHEQADQYQAEDKLFVDACADTGDDVGHKGMFVGGLVVVFSRKLGGGTDSACPQRLVGDCAYGVLRGQGVLSGQGGGIQ